LLKTNANDSSFTSDEKFRILAEQIDNLLVESENSTPSTGGVDTFETPSSGTVPSASVPGNPIIPIKYYSIENLHPSLAANPSKYPLLLAVQK
jgi:hypothetical protein